LAPDCCGRPPVWLAVAGVVVLWELIAAVAGKRAYFGAVQVPLSALNEAPVGIMLGAAVRSLGSA
jgi:hypothetical protein